MACPELNPESNENTEIDKTLENADDTTTNPIQSLITVPTYNSELTYSRGAISLWYIVT